MLLFHTSLFGIVREYSVLNELVLKAINTLYTTVKTVVN